MGGKAGMVTMDSYLYDLYSRNMISMEDTLFYSVDQEAMKKRLI